MKNRTRTLLTLSSLVSVIVFLPAAALAQSSLSGEVTGEDGQAIEGAVITLDRVNVDKHFEVKTDQKGRYFVGGLRPAFYTVVLVVDGQPRAHYKEFRIKMGNENKLDFDLAEIQRLALEQMTDEQREAIAKEKARREAAEKKFKDMSTAFNQGREYFGAKNYAAASTAFLRAAEIDPSQHVVFGNLAVSYQRLKKYDQAIETYQKAIGLLADSPDPKAESEYYFNIGIVHGHQGETDLAVEAMEKASALDPGRASQAFFNLGVLFTNGGQTSEAMEAFRKSIEANPENAEAHYQFGMNLVAMAEITPDGKTVPAPGTIEAFQNYLKYQPTGRYAAQAKGMIQTLSGTVATEFSAKDGK